MINQVIHDDKSIKYFVFEDDASTVKHVVADFLE